MGTTSPAITEQATTDIFEVMGTCRAMRYLRPDPIDEATIQRLIWAATRAPSPGNTQHWDFVVVTSPEQRAAIGGVVADALGERLAKLASLPQPDTSTRLMLEGAAHLAGSLGDAPLIVLVCGAVGYPSGRPDERFTWSAIYPAAQNLILAARALGLGSTFTTFQHGAEEGLRRVLGIPDDVRIGAVIPIGYPARPFTEVRRHPEARCIHRDRW
jgi:nitroreductase